MCISCAASALRPIGLWALTDLLPVPHHALIGFALTLFAIWQTRTVKKKEQECHGA